MIERTRQFALFALYQFTVILGIAAMPVALVLQRLGLTIPLHRIVESLEQTN